MSVNRKPTSKPCKCSPTGKPPAEPPLKLESEIEEIEDRHGASELFKAILRAQRRTAERKAREEKRDDAA
jgi:hypothetical protein